MSDLRLNFAEWNASAKGVVNPSCAIAIALTKKHAALAGRALGASDEDVRSAVSLGQRLTKGCEAADPASLFATTRAMGNIRTTTNYIGPNLYLYNDVALATINGWNGISDLAADVDAAVQNMPYQYPLTNEELEYLGALVEFASSSHDDAQAVSWTDNPSDTYEIGSLFATTAWPGKTFLKRVVGSDLTAFGAGFLAHNANDNDDDGISDSVGVGAAAAISASGAAVTSCVSDVNPCKAIH